MPRNLALRAAATNAASAVAQPDVPREVSHTEIPPEVPESRVRYVLQAILALGALILLSPVLLLVALAIKLTSPGPCSTPASAPA